MLRVTEILKAAGLIDTSYFTDFHQDRGTAVHAACHYLDEGDLDWSSLDPAVEPRVRSYERFLHEVAPEILEIELPVRSETYGYTGTVDRVVRIGGVEGVLDIKPPTRADWHRLQLMLYAIPFDRPMARWNLHLHDDGGYRLVRHENDRDDRRAALAAVTLAHWRNLCQQKAS